MYHTMKTAKNYCCRRPQICHEKTILNCYIIHYPQGMCDNQYESLGQTVNDVETFQYSHETSTKQVLVQGVYVGSASPL